MKVCITGGSGFVGRHFAFACIKHSLQPWVFVRNKTQEARGVILIDGALDNTQVLKRFFSDATILVNMIGRFDPPFDKQLEANALVPYKIFESAAAFGIKKIIHISAAAVYGALTERKNPTELDIPDPNTSYAVSKLAGEHALSYVSHKYKLEHVIIRPTNIYGEDAQNGVLYQLLSSLRQKRAVSIASDGNQERDFVHVDDVSNALIGAVNTQTSSGIYNIASGEIYSINALVKELRKVSQTPFAIHRVLQQSEHVRVLRADSTRAKNELGWMPKHNIKDFLQRVTIF